MSDRLGDLGLVGCVGVLDDRLVLFCLSCRVLGRQIECCDVDFAVKYWCEEAGMPAHVIRRQYGNARGGLDTVKRTARNARELRNE